MANPTIRTPFVDPFFSKERLGVPHMNQLQEAANTALRTLADLTPDETPIVPLIAFHVILNAALTPRSYYSGWLLVYDTAPVNTASGTAVTFGTQGDEIVIYNTIDDEVGSSGHMLTDSPQTRTIFPADRWSPKVTTDGKRIAIISQIDYKICPP